MKTCILMAVLATATYAQLLPPGGPQGLIIPGPSAPAAEMKPETVIATVAGISVTLADVRKMLQTAPQNLTQLFQRNPQEAIRQVYLMRYLAAEAEREKLDQKSPLKEEIDELIRLLKEQVLANAMVNQEHDGYVVSGDEIDAFYEKNKARWEEAKIKIILIGFKPAPISGAKVTEKDADEKLKDIVKGTMESAHPLNERTEAEAQKLAADLVKQLRGGADFAALVAKYSDDAESKASGGDFGTPIKATSSFAQDLKKVVFDMKPGDISDPVRQGNGLYIIRLEEKKVQPINDVRGAITTELRDNHRDEYLKELTNRFAPQVQRPDFFVQPQKYLAEPTPAPVADPGPAK